MEQRKIWLFKSHAEPEDIDAAVKVMKRGTWWTNGPEVKEFEETLAKRVGRKYGISFNSGTSALFSLLLAYGITGGEVIVPSFTFAAAPNVVVAAGATPVFADIEEQSLGLDPADVRRRITPDTRAIMPIHFAGDICAGIEELEQIADEHGIPLLVDAAESLGGRLGDRPVGSFGSAAMLSFCFNKTITSGGEGGMIVTDDEKIASELRLIRSHGRVGGRQRDYVRYGFNFRMPSLLAAIGLSQLNRLDALVERRREMAVYLNNGLTGVSEDIILPIPKESHYHTYQLYNLRFTNQETRNGLADYLAERGIETRVTWMPMHLYSYYRQSFGWQEGDLPVTESVAKRILTIPFHPDLSQDDLDYLIGMIRGFAATR